MSYSTWGPESIEVMIEFAVGKCPASVAIAAQAPHLSWGAFKQIVREDRKTRTSNIVWKFDNELRNYFLRDGSRAIIGYKVKGSEEGLFIYTDDAAAWYAEHGSTTVLCAVGEVK